MIILDAVLNILLMAIGLILIVQGLVGLFKKDKNDF